MCSQCMVNSYSQWPLVSKAVCERSIVTLKESFGTSVHGVDFLSGKFGKMFLKNSMILNQESHCLHARY